MGDCKYSLVKVKQFYQQARQTSFSVVNSPINYHWSAYKIN